MFTGDPLLINNIDKLFEDLSTTQENNPELFEIEIISTEEDESITNDTLDDSKNTLQIGEVKLIDVEDVLKKDSNSREETIPDVEIIDANKIKTETEEIFATDIAKQEYVPANVDSSIVIKKEILEENEKLNEENNAPKTVLSVDVSNADTISCALIEQSKDKIIPTKINCSTQTHFEKKQFSIDSLLRETFPQTPSSLAEAVAAMSQIDEWVSQMTKFRQEMFETFLSEEKDESNSVVSDKIVGGSNTVKRRRIDGDEDSCVEEITFNDIEDSTCDSLMQFEDIHDVIVVIRVSF